MSKQSDLVKKLKKFEFSEYASRAFLEIVKLGKATAPELAKAANIPQAKIYGVLDELYNKGFVGKDEDPKVTIYFADKPIKKFKEHTKEFSDAATSVADAIERLYETAGAHEYSFHSIGNYTDKLRQEDFIYIFASDNELFKRFFGQDTASNFFQTGGESDSLVALARHKLVALIDKGDRVQYLSIEDPLFSLAYDQIIAVSSVNRTLTTEMVDIQELEGEKILYIDSIKEISGSTRGQEGILWVSNKRLFVKPFGKATYARPVIALESCEINPDGRIVITFKSGEGIEYVEILPVSDSQIIKNLLEFVNSSIKK